MTRQTLALALVGLIAIVAVLALSGGDEARQPIVFNHKKHVETT